MDDVWWITLAIVIVVLLTLVVVDVVITVSGERVTIFGEPMKLF